MYDYSAYLFTFLYREGCEGVWDHWDQNALLGLYDFDPISANYSCISTNVDRIKYVGHFGEVFQFQIRVAI